MNQGEAEECRDSLFLPAPSSAAVYGKRVSLTDLFCTERFDEPRSPQQAPPSSSVNELLNSAWVQNVEAGSFPFFAPPLVPPPTPPNYYFNPTNPFFSDWLTEQQLRQLYVNQEQDERFQHRPYIPEQEKVRPNVQELEKKPLPLPHDQDEELQQPYIHEQYQWMHGLQPKYQVFDYISYHPFVTSTMRSELIQWLSEATLHFNYDIEIFLLAVNFVDRFLAGPPPYNVAVGGLQLLGSAALLVAAKIEAEVHELPHMDELLSLTKNGCYSAQYLIDMEILLLKKLKFQLCAPTASYFFEYYLIFTKESSTDIREVREMFHQLLKTRLVHKELMHYAPSTVAAAALCLIYQHFLPTPLPVEPLYWMTGGGQELADIQRCFFDVSVWCTERQLWAAATTSMLGNNSQSSSLCSSPVSAVEFCQRFANVSIAHRPSK